MFISTRGLLIVVKLHFIMREISLVYSQFICSSESRCEIVWHAKRMHKWGCTAYGWMDSSWMSWVVIANPVSLTPGFTQGNKTWENCLVLSWRNSSPNAPNCSCFPAISRPLLIFLFKAVFNLLAAVVVRVVDSPVATSRFKEIVHSETELRSSILKKCE